ncbi:MAG: trigger factor [Tannerella sp.]|jgi:trigger factor|nr:trigger factor [Tannerella sp.]
MNISLSNNDALSGILKIEVEKNDYESNLEKSLRDIRQKANMPGFRKGMVPLGMVKKMYGTQVRAEELNKLLSKTINDYIKENKLNILGEPLPNETIQKKMDLDNDENFEFCFDLAYRPEVDVTLSKDDKLTYYNIKIDDASVDEQINSYTKDYGTYEQTEKSEEGDMLKGILVELSNGEPNPDGIMIEDSVIWPKKMKGKTEQKKFIGAAIGKKIIFNPYKAFKGAEADIAILLKIEKAKTKEMKSDFSFELQEITHNKKAELNQELFDKIFGEGVVKDETEFRERIKSSLEAQYLPESEYKFIGDFHDLLLEKTENVTFADDILKRYFVLADEKNTKENIEQEYPQIVRSLRYQFAKDKLLKDYDLKILDEDVKKVAESAAKAQFAQYGMMSVPDNLLDHYVKKMMEKQETVNNLVERAIEEKLTAVAKEKITVEEKEVTLDEFFKTETKESEDKNKDKNKSENKDQ